MQTTAKANGQNNKNLAMVFLQVALLPLIAIAPVAAILVWGVGLEPSGRLARGILYGCLFLACGAVGHWKFSLQGTGITNKNLGRGFLYASIILVTGLGFMFAVQPPKALADTGLLIWSLVLFYLAVALAEETGSEV